MSDGTRNDESVGARNDESRPHLSHTQLELLWTCGEAYRRRYVEGERMPAGTAAGIGRAWHKGVEANFRQKIETHEDLPEDDVLDVAAGEFDALVGEGLGLTRDEQRRGATTVLGEAKDKTVELTRFAMRRMVSGYQPTHVEERVTVALPEASHDLVCVLDVAEAGGRISDFKTTSKRLDAAHAHHSQQLTIEAAAYRTLTGEPAGELRLHVVQTWAKPSQKLLRTTRGPEDFAVLAARVNVALAVLEAGVFQPAPLGSWLCSPKYCGFWSTCPYVNGRRPRE